MAAQRFSNVVYANVKAKMKAFNLYQTVSILYHYGHLPGCANFDNPTLNKFEPCKDDPEGRTEWKLYLSYPDNRRLYEFRQNVLRAKNEYKLEAFMKEHPLASIPWHPEINRPIPGLPDAAQPFRFLHGAAARPQNAENVSSSYFANDEDFTGKPAPVMEPTDVPGVSAVKKTFPKVPEVKTSILECSTAPATVIPPAPVPPAASRDAPSLEETHSIMGMFMDRLEKMEQTVSQALAGMNKRKRIVEEDEDIEEVQDSRPQSHDVRKFFQGPPPSAGADVPRSAH
jgi:hypothetical protein